MAKHKLFDQLIQFFEADDWQFQQISQLPILAMRFKGQHGQWMCYAQVREEEEQFVFYSVLPINVPQAQRQKFAEFITRANYGMVIGNFEMDFEDGEIRYKTSVDVEGSELTTALIRQLVYANLVITDQYLPGIMRTIYSDEQPSDILASLEQVDDQPDNFASLNLPDSLDLADNLFDILNSGDDELPKTNGNLPN